MSMNELKSPIYRESDEETDDEDVLSGGEDEDEPEDESAQPKETTHPDNKALMNFVDTVVPSGALDWKKNSDAIFVQYPELQRTSELSGKTVLHLLIDAWVKNVSIGVPTAHIKEALTRITIRYPELVQVRDGLDKDPGRVSGQSVLYSAISSFQKSIVSIIVNYCKPRDSDSGSKKSKKSSDPLSQAISVMCSSDGREENALHLAIRSPPTVVTPEKLQKLVKKANDTAVAAADKLGFTPLHYAVEYSRVSEFQYHIVKTLLKTGESRGLLKNGKAVLDLVTDAEKLSVYQYHVKTRESYREPKITNSKPPPGRSKPGRIDGARDPRVAEDGKRPGDRDRDRDKNRDRDGGADSGSEAEKEKARPPRAQRPDRPDRPDRADRPDRPEKPSNAPTNAPRGDEARNQGPGKGDKDAPSKDGPGKDGPSKDGPGKDGPSKDKDGPSADRSRDQKEGPRGRDARPDPRAPPGIRDESQRPKNDDPKTPLKKAATFKEPEPVETPEDRKRKRDEWSEKMKMEIKLQYLRTRSHHQSVNFLYGKNPEDIQISFEYSGLALEADADGFISSFKNVTFDNVLKYVAFPSVRVQNWKDNPLRTGSVDDPTRGRSDMLFFFKWLREKKRVERILKVIVEDNMQPPHSDEAIEMSLQPFGVEVLDWSRPDLDPETLFNASSELTTVTLHWGGNNAVLRAWSDPEGLRKQPNLSLVNLVVDGTLESTDRTKHYILEFEKRLSIPYAQFVPPKSVTQAPAPAALPEAQAVDRAAMPPPPTPNTGVRRTTTDVVVMGQAPVQASPRASKPPPPPPLDTSTTKILKPISVKGGLEGLSSRRNITNNGTSVTVDAAGRPPQSHRWLDATDAFAQCMDNVWEKIVKERNRDVMSAIKSRPNITPTEKAEIQATLGPPRDIIVAVIDDGVDATVEQLNGRVLTGRTFSYDEGDDRIRPWYVSENNHGTIMASMVCRVCPMAKIYPIRLRTSRTGLIDPMSAAQAIEAAIDRGADIISMSWTVTPPKPQSAIKAAFDKALQRAIDENVLMFCSAKDSGQFSEQWYPAGYRPELVIKIGAANMAGGPYEWAGSLDRLDFILPGVEVVQQHDKPPNGIAKWVPETGSSVATALGAGLAAVVMYCAHVAALYGKVGLKAADVDKLHRRDVMVEVLGRFDRSKETEGKFLQVWKRLKPRSDELDRAIGTAASRELIAGLARDLINTSS